MQNHGDRLWVAIMRGDRMVASTESETAVRVAASTVAAHAPDETDPVFLPMEIARHETCQAIALAQLA